MKNSLAFLIAFSMVLIVGICPAFGQETFDAPVVNSIVVSQPMATYTVQSGVFSAPISSYGWYAGGDGMHLLNDPSVMKDLELVDDQRDRLASVQKDFGKQLKEVMKEFGKAKNDQERLKELQAEMQTIQKEKTDALSNVLLPHQLDRIKQVSNQMQMNSIGTAGALRFGKLAKELEISDEQKRKLAEIQQELQKKIAEQTKKLKEAAKKQVLQELTADQRAKLKDMTGEEFKRDPKDWQERYNKMPKPLKSPAKLKKKSKQNREIDSD